MRVNARLDDSYQTKLDYLTETRQLSVSDVVRDALDHYYSAVKAEQARRVRGLESIIGMAESVDAPADLSANYKPSLEAGLDAKYPHHAHR